MFEPYPGVTDETCTFSASAPRELCIFSRGINSLLGANLVAEADGAFGTNAGIYLHFEGELSQASLPAAALTIESNSPMFVAELLANGTLGQRIPVLFQVSVAGANILPKRTIAKKSTSGFASL